ncbi:MAG: hypothetical protein MJ189_03195 [Coriobacteriales bacterium]|nr:hypothetical protein [Coriobacteriales bacterium]
MDEKFKNKKQFRHAAEIPLHVIIITLNLAILVFIGWLIFILPQDPELIQFLSTFFDVPKESIDASLDNGECVLIILLIIVFIRIVGGYLKYIGNTSSFEVKLSQTQMPQVSKICNQYSHRCGLKYEPYVYFYTHKKSGIPGSDEGIISPYIIRLDANQAKSYFEYESFWPGLEFLIAREIGHIYLGHSSVLLYFACCFARKIPFIGALQYRAMCYSADRVAAELVGENALQGLGMSLVKPKNTTYLNVEELFIGDQKTDSGLQKVAIIYNNLTSLEPVPALRIYALKNNTQGKLFSVFINDD